MTQAQAKKIGGNGHYILYWKSGGQSLAVVGTLADGSRWFAASNWTSKNPDGIASVSWRLIRSVGRLATVTLTSTISAEIDR